MKNSSRFYYSETQSTTQHTKRPSGMLDVNKLMSGEQACWISPTLLREQKQKKLILADWTASAWSQEKLAHVKNAMKTLVDEGFSIYIWQNGEVIPLDKYHLSTLEERFESMTMAFTEDIANAAVTQHKLTYDQVQVIDDYWLNYILNDHDVLEPRVLRTSELPELTPRMAKNLVCILSASTPRLEKIVDDHFCEKSHKNVSQLISAEIKADIEQHYTMATFKREEDLDRLNVEELTSIDIDADVYCYNSKVIAIEKINDLLEKSINLKKLNLNYYRILDRPEARLNFDRIPGLEEISLKQTNVSQAQLSHILASAQNLKRIDLSHCTCLYDFFLLPEDALHNIEYIALNDTNLSLKNLHIILKTSKKLREITLINSNRRQHEELDIDKNSLLKLEKIEINNMSMKNLQVIFKAAPNLRNIRFTGENLKEGLQIDENSLLSLENIELSYTNTSMENLQSIANAAPNMKNIFLYGCKNLSQPFQLRENSLLSLERIHLDGSNISMENLNAILKAAPNLKNITLNGIQIMDIPLQLDANNLSKLEAINLWHTNLSQFNLNSILKAAPNLKKIELGECKKLNRPLQLDDSIMSKIEFIGLGRTNISFEKLKSMIKSSPRLKKINLSCYKDMGNIFQLDKDSLSNLEEVDLSNTNLSIKNLEFILKSAKKLRRIDLRHFTTTIETLQLDEGSLCKIEEMDLSYTNLSSKNINAILAATPNLRKINLEGYGYEDHTENISFPNGCLSKLESIDLDDTLLSLESLQAILSAAPNLDLNSKNKISSSIKIIEDSNALRSDWSMKATPTIPLPTSSIFSRSPEILTENPIHDPSRMKDFEPKKSPFKFEGKNISKNQGMIIEKLSQYLTIKKINRASIPKLQDGICVALSHYFQDITEDKWNAFIEKVSAWNGDVNTLDDNLTPHFSKLYECIQQYQFSPQPSTLYLGDNLNALLDLKKACILSNPWHAIAIKPTPSGSGWLVYDPNYVDGCRTVRDDQLLKTIHDAIGLVVSVEKDDHKLACEIKDPNAFIAHGGLLALCDCANADEMLSKLPLPTNASYSKEALNGILLRSTSGKPAWVVGLASANPRIQQFTQTLKKQFQLSHTDAVQQLTKSAELLTPIQKNELITTLVQTSGAETEGDQRQQQDELIHTIRASANKPHYLQALKTWDKTNRVTPTAQTYIHQCLNSGQKKRLIELDSEQQLDTLRLHLQAQAIATRRPVFYIDSPSDLRIAQGYIQRQGSSNTGDFVKDTGGALHAFLKANEHRAPLLIVNYDLFNSDEMVTYNGLLDEKPHAVGTALPIKTMIIGLMNKNKPNRYAGSDFYSRFDCTQDCPLTDDQLKKMQSTRTVEIISENNAETTIINLYGAADWKEQLLGGWVINGDTFQWRESLLFNAIKKNKPIEIKNGLWGDKAFERFWRQALLGKIFHEDSVIEIPQGIKLLRPAEDVYRWAALNEHVLTVQHGFSNTDQAKALNPTCLDDFYGRYALEPRSDVLDGNKLTKKEGWLELAKGQVLDINLTRTLSDDAWARLLTQCQLLNVQLNIHCAPNTTLPNIFRHETIVPAHITGIPEDSLEQDLMITSTDSDTTVAMLKKNKFYEVIDISECTASDLLVRWDGTFNQDTSRFDFSQSNSALTTALAENKNIILKGHFSPELIDSLAPLWLERAQRQTTSQMILVTDDTQACPYASHRYMHAVSAQEKRDCLPFDSTIIETLGAALENEPLRKLITRCAYLKSNPSDHNSDNAWQGMNSLSGYTQASTAEISTTTSALESVVFTSARLAKVNQVLASSPYVFLAGLSGVGKSTFVEKELCTNDTLYLTEEKMDAWAQNTRGDTRKILFIDEANLSPHQWSEFEGLFNDPPTLLVNGVLHTLTQNHKVVFAGNPVNYGDERKLAPFFQRHGHAVLFTPLPPATIYEKILKPVFAGQDINHAPIAQRILDIYRFICECSTTDILISPRELQMMALLTMTGAQHARKEKIPLISEQISYDLAKDLVPPGQRAAFDNQFKPDNTRALTVPSQQSGPTQEKTFLVTPSRQRLSQQLEDLFHLREWRRAQTDALNQAQKGGGLGGIIIEGAPGIGKSELVVAALIARGYEEQHDLTTATRSENPFYRMPVSMPLMEKEALLIKAFNEGAVVMIDEINSSPMMERLLNDLLMGKNPKKIDDVVEKPGFMIIGTQNPVTMAGRRAASTALLRRLINTQLPDYTPDEVKTILRAKGVASNEADSMIDAYEENKAFAIANRLSPAPNFRDLIRLADHHLRSIDTRHPIMCAPDEALLEAQNINDICIRITNVLQAFMGEVAEKVPPYYVNKAIQTMYSEINHQITSPHFASLDTKTLHTKIQSKITACVESIGNAERTWGEFLRDFGKIIYEICALKPEDRTFQRTQAEIKRQVEELRNALVPKDNPDLQPQSVGG
jgi:Fe-S cluster assembly iron-binding protein IscA